MVRKFVKDTLWDDGYRLAAGNMSRICSLANGLYDAPLCQFTWGTPDIL